MATALSIALRTEEAMRRVAAAAKAMKLAFDEEHFANPSRDPAERLANQMEIVAGVIEKAQDKLKKVTKERDALKKGDKEPDKEPVTEDATDEEGKDAEGEPTGEDAPGEDAGEADKEGDKESVTE